MEGAYVIMFMCDEARAYHFISCELSQTLHHVEIGGFGPFLKKKLAKS
jgi:hypothetical protein